MANGRTSPLQAVQTVRWVTSLKQYVAILSCGHYAQSPVAPPDKVPCHKCRSVTPETGQRDIFGHPLRAGHCSTHPYIDEPRPCQICRDEDAEDRQDRDSHMDLEDAWISEAISDGEVSS